MTRRWFIFLLAGSPLAAAPLLAAQWSDYLLSRICGQSVTTWPALDRLLELHKQQLGSNPSAAALKNSPTTRLILDEAYQTSNGLAWQAVKWASPPGRLPTKGKTGPNSWSHPL